MHILANTQHPHKRTWPDEMDVCYTPSSNNTHPSFETNKHKKNTHLSFYLWALPVTLLRCIRLSALQIRDRLLRVKCHVCTNQIPGLGGDAESDGERVERRKRRNMVIHFSKQRGSDPIASKQLTAILSFRSSRLQACAYRKRNGQSLHSFVNLS